MQRKAKHWIGCHDWPKHQGGRRQGEKFTTADQRRERLKRVRWLPHTDLVALVRLVLAHDADAPADVRPQPAQNQPIIEKTKSGSRVGIALVGAFATIAGIGEIIVGLTGNYLGILTHSIPLATSTIIIGAFYSLGGLSILTMRKLGAALGIFFIACEVPGRLYLVMIGIAPGGDAIKIVVIGGLLALTIIGYVASQWKKFD